MRTVHALALSCGLTATLALSSPAAGADTPWDADGPWGPYGWDAARDRFHQPQLSAPIPDPAPLGRFDTADFDRDGVPNIEDNCLLVPNPGQQPTHGRQPIGPGDMLMIAERWKAGHPNARFRMDAELGTACSGYNNNYLRTTRELIKSPNRLKLKIFRFLGQSGPMFGGAVNPFPSGKPTDYDRFGTVTNPPDLEPNPTTRDDLPQGKNGKLAKGNMTPSMPMCSGYSQYAGFMRWMTGIDDVPVLGEGLDPVLDRAQGEGGALYRQYEDQFGCGSDSQRRGWEQAMRHWWAGKRLYTNPKHGRITNRFGASVTEHPLYEQALGMEPFNTLAEQSGAHPYADDASGQSRHGIIFRGKSYVDGRDTILMDWRGFEAAWPLGPGSHVEGLGGMLIYDECRAIQTGVYHCTAVLDVVIGDRRHTFQEGYMPWVVKGPPTIEEYLEAIR